MFNDDNSFMSHKLSDIQVFVYGIDTANHYY
ncbi:hypothetical protein SAMN04489723_106218 [Algoriphagus aquimarinus]|uniref:Uncharacterized protein n=1 Tax=Algoriphagus aquimarinus TaxID=237018 RepID=A0A1I0ZSN9_9BACT|nr:hypothetical protein SAMN04489723_106218 [Algoriphagus aquimarinus]